MKRITMYGRTFEVKRVKGIVGNYCRLLPLDDCYNRPSRYKEDVYYSWVDFFRLNFPLPNLYGYDIDYGVRSFNVSMFTFDCIYRTPKATLLFHITPSHNYLTIYTID